MSGRDHIAEDLLIRAIDDEVSGAERIAIDDHLSGCEECRARYRELGALSVRLESAVAGTPIHVSLSGRAALDGELARREAMRAKAGRANGRLRWAAVAAALALFSMLWAPRFYRRVPGPGRPEAQVPALTTFEVDGETFVSLPYSNPYLPASSERIVQMQVPVSSLADAGLVFEPVSTEAANRSVLADVLLGADGEPVGVHVISAEP